MKSTLVLVLITFCLSYQSSLAQYQHIDVLKGEKGSILLDDLQEQYTPAFTLDYSVARDTLFAKIDAVDHILECVYTGLKLSIHDGQDPTDAVYLNGNNNGINTEHTYPQSFGIEFSQARSDMHNLFPTRVKTNSDRGNLPFGESADNQTSKWYLESNEMSTIPTQNIDAYSELDSGKKFEPRESHKGDVARAMFYMYTIYRDLVSIDTNFFVSQKQTLCDWHYLDPVDKKEWERTYKIATYQNGKVNPFVLDCSLPARLYCDHISEPCALISGIDEHGILPKFYAAIVPNPIFRSEGSLVIRTEKEEQATLVLMDGIGRIVWRNSCRLVGGESSNLISIPNDLNPGLYFMTISLGNKGEIKTLKMIVE